MPSTRRMPVFHAASLLALAIVACASLSRAVDETPTLAPSPAPPTATRPLLDPTPQTPVATGPPQATVEAATPTAAATPVPATPIPRLVAGQPVTVTTIHMLDAQNGWAVGGLASTVLSGLGDHILRTGDGGSTWQDVTPPEPVAAGPVLVEAVGHFLDANTAWVTYAYFNVPAAPVVWRTRDGGRTWEASRPVDVGFADYYSPSDIQFVDVQTGWTLVHLGAGMSHDYVALLATADGGATWERVVDPDKNNLQMSCGKTGMAFADAQWGWVTGDCGGVAPGVYFQQTRDGGRTWEAVDLPPPEGRPDLFTREDVGCGTYAPTMLSPQSGLLVVRCFAFSPDPFRADHFLYTTTDGGQTWRSAPAPASAVTFLNAETGWALAATDPSVPAAPRDLYQTRDGGQTWARIKTVNWDGRFSFINEREGWAVARVEQAVALVHTTDGGLTWAEIKPQVAP